MKKKKKISAYSSSPSLALSISISLFLSYGTIIARYSELSAVAFTDAMFCISAVQFP
jgi:hypothetical protein